MHKFLAAAVPALMLMAAAVPGHAQSGSSRSEAVASGRMDTGARGLPITQSLVGKKVYHRHGGPVAGTIQSITTGTDGQPVAVLDVRGASAPVMLGSEHFERRGNRIIVMHDQTELQQLAQYASQGNTAYGSSMDNSATGNAMGSGSMGNSSMGNGSMGTTPQPYGTMNRNSTGNGSMGNGSVNDGSMSRGMAPNQPGLGQ
ncbi:hypothetical protein [Azospirillum picis]|uniref:PRC-barrel domain-containing protein n=1 Tax=Azospirillum picis TaxID=488438 RepID=A0ABU0MK03_9PROT|nr:hypothetical protein [Azospirillum picis]MBP2299961.1 hypothetical protein [Azospirillum picis]MDQ0533801.1 hypothetical protein [Azospirillum picis]